MNLPFIEKFNLLLIYFAIKILKFKVSISNGYLLIHTVQFYVILKS